MRYLDPKNDLTFKKIFGQNPDLAMSLLNALMPFDEDQYIVELEYLPPEQVPDIPVLKNSIVDVKCRDNKGRQFIIEMQVLWTQAFKTRVLFNASKAYVRQLDRGKKYEGLQPVYSLNLVDDVFLDDTDEFYHHYSIVNVEDTNQRIEGLEFVFVELPKFVPQTMIERKMAVLWLRFLTEIQDGNETVAEDLKESSEIRKALEILNESAFSRSELDVYDRYWDAVSRERTLLSEKTRIAEEKGMARGLEKGLEKGMEKGHFDEKVHVIINAHKAGLDYTAIATIVELSVDKVRQIIEEK